jgi:hypothetical protein
MSEVKPITRQEAEKVLSYSPQTGVFTWVCRVGTRRAAGDVAGYLHSTGCITIGLNKKHIKAHRLAWLFVYDEWPAGDIDHINGNRTDNRIENLRIATKTQNAQNQRRGTRNKHGLLGIKQTPCGNWTSSIRVDGVLHHIGTFHTAQEAHTAYVKTKQRVHPFFVEMQYGN